MASKKTTPLFTERQKLLLRVHFSFIDMIDEWRSNAGWPHNPANISTPQTEIAERLCRAGILQKTHQGCYQTTEPVHRFIEHHIPS